MGELDWQQGMPDTACAGGLVVAHYGMRFLADAGGVLFARQWLTAQLGETIIAEQGIGYLNGEPVFMLELEQPVQLSGFSWLSLRQFMLDGRLTLFRLLGFASQIGTWAREHRFCGSCGQAMQQAVGHRMMQCHHCQLQQYPRLSPSMIVVVSRGDEILLARSMNFVSNAAALSMFIISGNVAWALGIGMGAALMLGAAVGAKVAIGGGNRLIRPVFILVVMTLAARLAWQHWFGAA